jgi:hypothetical protein
VAPTILRQRYAVEQDGDIPLALAVEDERRVGKLRRRRRFRWNAKSEVTRVASRSSSTVSASSGARKAGGR